MAFFILLFQEVFVMRYFKLFLGLIFFISISMYSQDLSDYRWKNRILFLFDPGEMLEKSTEQIKLFKAYQKEMEERNLIFLIFDGKVTRDGDFKIISQVLPPDKISRSEGVFLIGKDGGVKWESEYFAEPSVVFEIIDSMPMRRSEMRRKNKP
ncbi:DUF4174 domain-containing protein [Muriicola soli]|uniref:DUF4174 domain-containing protein n=1 Tax=Muriicola soli TaxID=2507538 RepID=A0A411E7J3_9FLAO|nr:DUF4174 domain-containing protein [Muriicola soli]QBA63493.1 DUF4174 domain-containing protein [Muriicola soli]